MDVDDSDRVACRALALAVLKEALSELNDARRLRKKACEKEVTAWIESDSDTWIFAFVPLCQWLGFDVEVMRKKLRK